MKTLIIIATLALLSGCQSYNSQRQDVANAYMSGQISEAEYTAHWNTIQANEQAQYQRQQNWQNGMNAWKQNQESRETKRLQRAQTTYYNNENANAWRKY